MRVRVTTPIFAAVCAAILLGAGAAQAQPSFILEAGIAAPRDGLAPPVVKQRFVDVDAAPLAALSPRGGDRLRFDLFDGFGPVGIFEKRDDFGAQSVSWSGRLEGLPGGYFVLTAHRGAVHAHIDTADGRVFELRTHANGHYELLEKDAAQFAGCGTGTAHAKRAPALAAREPAPAGAAPRGDDGSRIDVLVLYTTAARIAAGGTNGIESLIVTSVNLTNSSYGNSLVNPRLRLVHMAETSYTESLSGGTDLDRLTDTNDGHIDEAHSLRNTYGADLVALIVNDFDVCGIAWLMTSNSPSFQSLAFSVTARGCAASNLTFAHELGHNQGCQHDRDNAGTGIYPYAYGYRFQSGGLKRTIMAYDPGTRVNHFSNPDVLYNGVPTGVPIGIVGQEAHNAQTINNTALTVSQYRDAIPEDFDPPTPNPMTFDAPPTAVSASAITMTATPCSDENLPCQYYFGEVSGNPGGNASGWQLPNSYMDSDLTPNTEYAYQVMARDDETVPNQTAFSDPATAVTHIQAPVGMASFDTGTNSVQLTATGVFTNLNVGMSGIYFDADPPGSYGGIGTWQQTNSTFVTGLLAGRSYTFRAKARNQVGVETAWSAPIIVDTIPLIGDCNNDGVLDMEGDVPCFVDALLEIDEPEGAIYRSDLNFDGVTDGLDVTEMVNCMIYGCN